MTFKYWSELDHEQRMAEARRWDLRFAAWCGAIVLGFFVVIRMWHVFH